MNARTTLQSAVQRYLKERRQLGFAMTSPATELMRFARFADARGHKGPLTRELQLEWARQHVRRTSTVTAARRIEILRPFAAYYRQFEVNTEVLPTHALGRGHRRLTPHIYTEEEIEQLLRHAGRLAPVGALRPLMYRTLFGLIAAVGLRLSEALKLRVGDVDLEGRHDHCASDQVSQVPLPAHPRQRGPGADEVPPHARPARRCRSKCTVLRVARRRLLAEGNRRERLRTHAASAAVARARRLCQPSHTGPSA
jgi:integrase